MKGLAWKSLYECRAALDDALPAMSSSLSFDRTEFLYEPFPIGYTRDVLPRLTYDALVDAWPEVGLFEHKPKLGDKYSLSEVNNPDGYERFVAGSAPWRDLREEVKSAGFVAHVLAMLKTHNIDLGIGEFSMTTGAGRFAHRARHLAAALRPGGRRPSLSTRFEFSMLPAAGGYLKPHTDAPSKIVTLVISMMREGEWRQDFGGGTAVMRPRDPRRNFNHVNEQLEFSEVETLSEFPFVPNQCVTFVKTFNSWHAVRPMASPVAPMRRTLTINIERWDV